MNSYEEQVQSYQKKLAALDELQNLKLNGDENGSIVEGLSQKIQL